MAQSLPLSNGEEISVIGPDSTRQILQLWRFNFQYSPPEIQMRKVEEPRLTLVLPMSITKIYVIYPTKYTIYYGRW